MILITVHEPTLTESQSYALARCRRILGGHDVVLVHPKGMSTDAYRKAWPDLHLDPIAPSWQSSYQDLSRLKVSPFLYRRYRGYEFVLFHELDALVFRDDLAYWCRQEYDYIGAPWFVRGNDDFEGVGNGGFSLRRTSACLRVTRSLRKVGSIEFLSGAWSRDQWCMRTNHWHRWIAALVGSRFHYMLNAYRGPEDVFWGRVVPRRLEWFRVAPPEVALRFSFEARPARLYEMNGGLLPFGCHAWEKWQPEFYAEHVPDLPWNVATEGSSDRAQRRVSDGC